MKLTGPLACLFCGFLIYVFGWMSGLGPPDHNIGRSIASSILRQGIEIFGGLISIIGIIWLLVRWFDRPTR